MENNRDKVNRKYSDESLGNQIRNQSEKSSSNGIRNMKSSDPHMRSSISTDKSSSDLTTIKVTDEEYLLENSWKTTETPGLPLPLNRKQSSDSSDGAEIKPFKPPYYESIDNYQNRSVGHSYSSCGVSIISSKPADFLYIPSKLLDLKFKIIWLFCQFGLLHTTIISFH